MKACYIIYRVDWWHDNHIGQWYYWWHGWQQTHPHLYWTWVRFLTQAKVVKWILACQAPGGFLCRMLTNEYVLVSSRSTYTCKKDTFMHAHYSIYHNKNKKKYFGVQARALNHHVFFVFGKKFTHHVLKLRVTQFLINQDALGAVPFCDFLSPHFIKQNPNIC